eukprot:scaffold88048_cov69-Phaeocystis_antarctica.AAC.9
MDTSNWLTTSPGSPRALIRGPGGGAGACHSALLAQRGELTRACFEVALLAQHLHARGRRSRQRAQLWHLIQQQAQAVRAKLAIGRVGPQRRRHDVRLEVNPQCPDSDLARVAPRDGDAVGSRRRTADHLAPCCRLVEESGHLPAVGLVAVERHIWV